MSVDFAPKTQPSRFGLVSDLFIVIGGYALEDAYRPTRPLPPTPSYSGTGDLLKRIQSEEVVSPDGHQKKILGLKGTVLDNDVKTAFGFIEQNFDPKGKLIVYGHSMGGAAVLALCRKIDFLIPYYDFQSGLTFSPAASLPMSPNWGYRWARPGPVATPPPSGGIVPPSHHAIPPEPMLDPVSRNNAVVRVDLLVTVDAARGPASESLDRSIAACVRTNLNYYQTVPHGREASFGGPNKAANPARTVVWNHDLTGRPIPDPDSSRPPSVPTHDSIDEQTNNTVMMAIQRALVVKQFGEFMDIVP